MKRELLLELMQISNLENRAYSLVKYLFSTRVDKAGNDYLGHLERVRDNFSDSFYRTIALLHDTVEDTELSFSDLQSLGYSDEYLEVLRLLTHSRDSSYHDYISQIICSKNKVAILVKIADMVDNMNEGRLSLLKTEVQERLKNKYAPEMIRLEEIKGEMNLC